MEDLVVGTLIFVFIVSMILTGTFIGKRYVINQYNYCIEMGAPQENCLKELLGEK